MSPTIAHSLLNRFNHKKPSLNANHVFAPMSSDEVFFIHDMSCQMKRGGPSVLQKGGRGVQDCLRTAGLFDKFQEGSHPCPGCTGIFPGESPQKNHLSLVKEKEKEG